MCNKIRCNKCKKDFEPNRAVEISSISCELQRMPIKFPVGFLCKECFKKLEQFIKGEANEASGNKYDKSNRKFITVSDSDQGRYEDKCNKLLEDGYVLIE